MSEDKTIVRWDGKRGKWRRLYERTDGTRRLSRDWWQRCPRCEGGYWGSQLKKICWDCGLRHYKELQVLSTKAVSRVAQAIREGNLCRLDGSIPCVDCGRPAQVYDHRSYLKPLDVDPVCRSCNVRRGPAIEHEPIVLRLPNGFTPLNQSSDPVLRDSLLSDERSS